MPKNRRKRASRSSSNSSAVKMVVSSNRPTGSTTSFPSSDLRLRRQNFNIIQTPPRSLSNQIFWTMEKYDAQYNVSSTGISEYNLYFTANLWPGTAALLAAFDQYCIHSIVATFSSNANVTTPFRIWTAIDYDSVSALGSKLLIQQFSTCVFASIAGDGSTSAERLLFPCIAPQVTSGVTPVPGGISRAWIDSAYPSVNHYGLRMIFDSWINTGVSAIEVTYTAIFGFRNSF